MSVKKAVVAFLLILLGLFLVYEAVEATTYTKTLTWVQLATYGNYLRFQHTFVGAQDTVYMPFTVGRSLSPEDTTLFALYVYTTSLNGDSVDIGVRYETSSDNTNWKSYTIGTDSTTWVTTKTGSDATLNVFYLGAPSYGGYSPYSRVTIIGLIGNNTNGGTKVKVDILEQ